MGEESITEDLEALFPWTRAANTSVGSSYENDKVHFLKRDPSIGMIDEGRVYKAPLREIMKIFLRRQVE